MVKAFSRMIGEDFQIERISRDTISFRQRDVNGKAVSTIVLVNEIDEVIKTLQEIKKLSDKEIKEEDELERLKAWNSATKKGMINEQ